MPYLQACWSPCWCYNNLKHGCIAVAIYTIVLHIVFIAFTIWEMTGGRSSDLYSPFFETDVKNSTTHAGIAVIIVFSIAIITAILLWKGAAGSIRGMLLPWLFYKTFFILFAVAFGMWFVARYYIDPHAILAALFTWLFAGLEIYCYLCVISQYQILKMYQSPNIVVLYP